MSIDVTEPYLGSTWRHWDLHVHTPESYEHQFPGETHEEKWENYLRALERLEGVQVLGITDYCTLNGFRRVQEHFEAGKLPNIELVLPNLEFRLVEATEDGRNVNLHVITSPEVADELPRVLLTKLDMSYAGERYSCRYEDLVRLGKAFRDDGALQERAAFCVGANQFKITRDQLEDAFKKSELLRENALIAVPNRSGDGGSGLRESGQRVLRLEIYRLADMIISANPADRDHFLGLDGKLSLSELRRDYGGRMPCIGGSDAHCLKRIANPDEERLTWIKADPSFEGLLQICHEPEFRVIIAANPPSEPIHRLRSVTITVPAKTVLQTDDGVEPFCMSGEREIGFAPGLTCVIGGRGSGKSTLLSLIQEAAVGESPFFEDKSLQNKDANLVIGDLVELDVTSSPETMEFLNQNQIETFALDSARLTHAVYNRLLKQDSTGELSDAIEALQKELADLQELQDLNISHSRERARLDDLKREEISFARLIDSLKDKEYTELVGQADSLNTRISEVRIAREELGALVDQLEEVLAEQPATSSEASTTAPPEPYSERTRALREAVRRAIRDARLDEDLSKPSAIEERLQDELDEVNDEIAEFLDQRGISEENARDLITATEKLTGIREEITRAERRLADLDRRRDEVERNSDAKEKFEKALMAVITPINNGLRSGPETELHRISIAYQFDHAAAIRACQSSLIQQEIDSSEKGRQLREDHVASLCESINWEELPNNVEQFAADLGGDEDAEGETAHRIIEHLIQPGEYERFRLQVEEYLSDALQFKRIEVRYDGKRLQQASFGQRCSAALIVLLMLGNQPIVIDEPEAHLDSSLIASLLVDLIKRRKTERQIIFATHNANFVVNGDSELIHVLSLEAAGPTKIASISLEDRVHRSEILRLEGGEEAFAQREQRYGFRGRFSRPIGA